MQALAAGLCPTSQQPVRLSVDQDSGGWGCGVSGRGFEGLVSWIEGWRFRLWGFRGLVEGFRG